MKLLSFLFLFPLLSMTGINQQKHTHFSKLLLEEEYITIDADVISNSPFRVNSSELIEVNAKIGETDIDTYGYVQVGSALARGGIYRGYFFYGECLVFGTLVVTDDDQYFFFPCSADKCIGGPFQQLCPQPGNGLCRMNFPKK